MSLLEKTEPPATPHDLAHFEEFLSTISTRFINLPADQIDSQIERTQQITCDSLGFDLSALYQWSEHVPRRMVLTHLYSPAFGPDRPKRLDAAETFPWSFRQIQRGKALVLHTDELPPEAQLDIAARSHFGVKSSVVLPLSVGGQSLCGILSFDTLQDKRQLSETAVQRLELVGQIFINSLARQSTERQLRLSKARLHLAADCAQAGIWEFDFHTQQFWATQRARDIFGYDHEGVISMEQFEASVHPDDLEHVRGAIENACDPLQQLDVEYRIMLADHQQKWISSRGRIFCDRLGNPRHLLGISIDISHHKQLENDLQAKLFEVEQLKQRLESENYYLREDLIAVQGFEKIVGHSKAMRGVQKAISQVAPTDATVLLQGETGTGKGLIADALHKMSARADTPLVTVNCAALPHNLIESELFGRQKGAFTGAHADQAGRFEVAHLGTIFLDEIGEMPIELQVKLLRVLQDGEFELLGSAKSIKVDVRVIAATNRCLREAVRRGTFREDLYYRLNGFPITLPPLRERVEDIAQLAQHFTAKFAARTGKQISQIPRDSLAKMRRYPWPGNVRELEHLIERSVILSTGPTLMLGDQLNGGSGSTSHGTSLESLASVERKHLLNVLKVTAWRIEGPDGAAAILDLHPSTLRFRMKKLNIQRPQ